ncbi:GDP-mannose dehydrogenase, partial [candidate division KSB1 bacterium]|nr:GDP-mannose dehydrogenase [candidate division KSB1 bacterium]NIR72514.1 GDP-mannose dehydrogenase [candidate division KSB1 bacterium]NIS23622.1 GDP-mannose dehydrogenase [candidate division KSB1 bacterium]NIT70548.1 GDP-mannose dehydrogenase [candidate division KSB1 bacterium]NIU24255.1 GDP-mannose dehydrogenase [candidate division KSB1 bacterium]
NPMVELIERLIGKGYDVSIFDREVALARPFGSNKRYIEHVIPHVSSLMKPSPVDVVADAEVIVVGKKTREFANIVAGLDGGKTVVDLVRIAADTEQLKCNYEGICW